MSPEFMKTYRDWQNITDTCISEAEEKRSKEVALRLIELKPEWDNACIARVVGLSEEVVETLRHIS